MQVEKHDTISNVAVTGPRFLDGGGIPSPVRHRPIPRDLPPLYPEREAEHTAAVQNICAAHHHNLEVRVED